MNAIVPIASVAGRDRLHCEAEAWRGRCLDWYARAERKVLDALLAADASGYTVRVAHLAGQRLAELQKIAEGCEGTVRQKVAFSSVVDRWRALDRRRGFLAHGRMQVLRGGNETWHARFDQPRIVRGAVSDEQWVVDQAEAAAFEREVAEASVLLGSQLGQLRKRLA